MSWACVAVLPFCLLVSEVWGFLSVFLAIATYLGKKHCSHWKTGHQCCNNQQGKVNKARGKLDVVCMHKSKTSASFLQRRSLGLFHWKYGGSMSHEIFCPPSFTRNFSWLQQHQSPHCKGITDPKNYFHTLAQSIPLSLALTWATTIRLFLFGMS